MKTYKIGIIGAGNMGSAILKGLFSRQGIVLPEDLYLNDTDDEKVDMLVDEYKVLKTDLNELVDNSEYIILAVKPQDSAVLLNGLSGKLKDKTLISIMAGVSIDSMNDIVGKNVAIVRAMPNLAAVEGESITAYAGNGDVKDMEAVRSILSSIGEVEEVQESWFDGVTAVSGSGPAYIFYLAEAMIAAAVEFNIDKHRAEKLVKQTFSGAAKLLDKAPDPEKLIERVASKGGTTEAALSVFDDENMRDIIITAMKKAKTRSEELSNK